jgi:polyhydroxyalkanoate synthesis repressor PhaR
MSNTPPESAKRLDIKKYPNRRYYDSTQSRHLTLEEIRSLIQQGYDLRVVDAKTNADITAQVLTQIILELDTTKLDSLPVPMLVRLIRMNDQLIKDFIDKYFNQALQSFIEYQRQLEEQLRRSHGLPTLLPGVAAWTKAMLDPFTAAFNRAQPEPAAESAPPRAAESGDGDLQAQLRQLQEELDRLKQQRARPKQAPRRKPKRRKMA